jgi:hypothetical protein
MARLNDNLFTTLVDCIISHEMNVFFLVRIRWVRVQFTEKGLSELAL